MHRPLVAAAALLLLAATASAQENEPAWAEAAKAMTPEGYAAGRAYPTDTEADEGYVAAYPASANDPRNPASVFGPRSLLKVKLEHGRPVSATIVGREEAGAALTLDPDTQASEDEYTGYHEELRAGAADLPPGTEPCSISGWSTDPDPKGLNVRAQPSAKAAILGTLSPPYESESETWKTEFSILGFKNGWFLIEGAEPPGLAYVDPEGYPKDAPAPYAGRGWVAASRVGGSFAAGNMTPNILLQAPFEDAARLPTAEDAYVEVGGIPKRLLACSGYWALVESDDGVIGWWRGLCSNQATNCS